MDGVNKVILIGNLGKDPAVRYLESGSGVANLTLATTESDKNKEGQRVDNTEWHDLELWDGLAKIAEQYLSKGKSIYVEGRIKSDTWQDDQGNNRKRTKIRVQNLTMLGGAPSGSEANMSQASPNQGQRAEAPNNQQAPPAEKPAPTLQPSANDAVDDLPF